ncbi:RICIN domain-containing protein [Mucilaginibacter sp. Bleaf8]|uniref:glycoside hydrolase family 76 protein n=1 Tax=Mucilaginibacter sp. Bleaf8 TaxID=2834430 RepID=UPI001BD13BA1|nr:glycoside hydrolase family 76 protein [Mucilaginibacter sp. Bleaf8]MBS7564797.1 RICIN domain-containing protein [Mucilaginibacter sp. Bleaf8]
MRKTNIFKQCIFGLMLTVASLWVTGCKKSESIADLAKTHSATPPDRRVNEINSQADAAFNAYTNAFLITQGNTQFFKARLNDATKDYFWQQALDIQGVEDTYLRTKSAAHKTLITNLLNTFLQQNQGNGGLYDWNWNEFNDDILWAGIAFARGYQITQNPIYLTQAKYAFNRAYDRGWDGTLGGGIWWDIRRGQKSGLSNNTAVILGCYIYESTKETAYLTKAQAIYDWIWSHIYDHTTGAVWEEMRKDGSIAMDANVYNVGAFISAANHLHRITGLTSIYDDAKRSVDYVRNNKTTGGILSGSTRNGTWASEFARGLGEFVRDNNLWSTYYAWMKQNADAAWAKRRTDYNITWNNWLVNSPVDDTTRANECISAVVMQQVTPATQPGLTDNGIYRLTPKMASGSALDIDMTSKLADIWVWGGGSNQKFKIVPLNYGYYRLVPQSATTMSLDVAGNSNANDTPIQIYTANNNSSQYFKLVYDYDGYYKLKPRCAPSSCVNVKGAGTANGTKCVLWQESFVDNERWLMQLQ